MDCVNHPGVNAAAYCQNCGKAMCTDCMRREATGQVMCEPCWMAWQGARAAYAAPVGVGGGCPSPVAAAILGFIPGVGAMFNGQFLKGFAHVIIFAVLVSLHQVSGVFGLLVAAWIFYQVFDAFQTAKAKCMGLPEPDPLGLNEFLHSFVNEHRRSQGMPPAPGAGPVPPPPPVAGAAPTQGQNPYQGGYQPPVYPQYGAPPMAGFTPGYPPPPAGYPGGVPPVPQLPWRRREPVAAIILIAMGVLFLAGEFSWHVIRFAWPVLLIGLGAWLVVRRMRDTPTAMPPPMAGTQPGAPVQEQHSGEDDLQGGTR